MTNQIKKYADFSRKSGKLVIQIKDNYYINWKNVIIFHKICTENMVEGFPSKLVISISSILVSNYYINWKNVIIFHKICTENMVEGLPSKLVISISSILVSNQTFYLSSAIRYISSFLQNKMFNVLILFCFLYELK